MDAYSLFQGCAAKKEGGGGRRVEAHLSTCEEGSIHLATPRFDSCTPLASHRPPAMGRKCTAVACASSGSGGGGAPHHQPPPRRANFFAAGGTDHPNPPFALCNPLPLSPPNLPVARHAARATTVMAFMGLVTGKGKRGDESEGGSESSQLQTARVARTGARVLASFCPPPAAHSRSRARPPLQAACWGGYKGGRGQAAGGSASSASPSQCGCGRG